MAAVTESKARSRTIRRRAEEAARALGIAELELERRVPLEWPDYPGARELVP
jgi:hypothetical protein